MAKRTDPIILEAEAALARLLLEYRNKLWDEDLATLRRTLVVIRNLDG